MCTLTLVLLCNFFHLHVGNSFSKELLLGRLGTSGVQSFGTLIDTYETLENWQRELSTQSVQRIVETMKSWQKLACFSTNYGIPCMNNGCRSGCHNMSTTEASASIVVAGWDDLVLKSLQAVRLEMESWYRKHGIRCKPPQPTGTLDWEPSWTKATFRKLHQKFRDLHAAFESAKRRYLIVDSFLPDVVVEAILEELPEQNLCELISKCAAGLGPTVTPLPGECSTSKDVRFLQFCGRMKFPNLKLVQELNGWMTSLHFRAFLYKIFDKKLVAGWYVNDGGAHSVTLPLGYHGIHKDFSLFGKFQGQPAATHKKEERASRLNAILFLHELEAPTGHLEIWDDDPVPQKPTKRELV